MDIPRTPPDDDPQIKARVDLAGRFGCTLGCIAAVSAVVINLYRTPRSWDEWPSVALAVLMAALNIPLGIMLGLFGEKLTRPKRPGPPRRRR